MNRTKKIAIIGGSYLQLPAVLKAQEAGFEVHCFAWADGAVCKDVANCFYPISIREKEEILEVCRKVGIDGVFTIASDLAVPTVNYIAEKLGLPGNEYAWSGTMTNKYLMREAFLKADIPSPRFFKVKAGDALPELAGRTMIVKPTDRSGSRGVEKVTSDAQLRSAVDFAIGQSLEGGAIIEDFIEGREISVESISFQGQHHVLQITDKITTGEPYFIELAHHQPSNLPQDIQQKVRLLVPKVLDALHISIGASHTEIKITPSGELKVIETGARMGGDFIGSHLVRLSTGYDFLKATVMAATGVFEAPQITASAYSGVYFLSKENEHLRPYFMNPETVPETVESAITNPELKDIRSSADRSGYLIYRSEKGRLELK